VAAAVPGLSPERVTLVDDRGTLLAQAEAGDGSAVSSGEAEDQRVALENRLRARIVQLLERSVGAGRVDAAVSADMDFDEVATTAETFDPNGQVVRSTQTNEEDSNAAERQPEDPVTVANNLPTERATAAQGGAEATSSERSKRTEETVNYEIHARSVTRPGAGRRAPALDRGAGRRHLPARG
jgi:flagellar M-ring protein FliF